MLPTGLPHGGNVAIQIPAVHASQGLSGRTCSVGLNGEFSSGEVVSALVASLVIFGCGVSLLMFALCLWCCALCHFLLKHGKMNV